MIIKVIFLLLIFKLMETITESCCKQINDEDQDCEIFFLQPASSPYDIKEKIKTANEDLQLQTIFLNKESKVKFTSEFTYYEPEEENDVLETCCEETVENLKKLQIREENLESEEEIISEKITDSKADTETSQEFEHNLFSFDSRCPSVIFGGELQNENENFEEETLSEGSSVDTLNGFEDIEENEEPPFKSEEAEDSNIVENDYSEILDLKIDLHMRENSNKSKGPSVIICKSHCIDKFDSVEKIINKKFRTPSCCPMLKLRKRNCCENNEYKKQQKLPNYSGKRSEYGMSAKEKKEARKQKVKEEQLKREELAIMEENRKRRIEENEKIFMNWLQNVNRKKKVGQIKTSGQKNNLRPNTAKIRREKSQKSDKERKRRPKTCPASICVEIPKKILEKGLIVGDVKITMRNVLSDRLHLMEIF